MSHRDALPPELAKYNFLHFIKRRSRNEWSAECVRCGDSGHVGSDWPDRMRLFASDPTRGLGARVWCRSCGHFEFADDGGWSITEAERRRIEAERTRLAQVERVRVQKKIARIEESAFWRGYHDRMTDEERALWQKEGIPPSAQDWWELGFNPSYTIKEGDVELTFKAMTIPYFAPSDDEKHIVNVQSRLLGNAPGGKYRFLKDLPVPLFFADHSKGVSGRILLVEGGKKAMVSFLQLGERFDNVIASPSKYIQHNHISQLEKADEIIVAFDPDANWKGEAVRAAEKLGSDRVRIATLPSKIDDLFVKYGASADTVARYLDLARPLKGFTKAERAA